MSPAPEMVAGLFRFCYNAVIATKEILTMARHDTQAPSNQPQRVRVQIIESGRGWEVDDTHYFDTPDEADAFVKGYNKCNKCNNLDYVPGWYMYAMRA
jgi:hypothetical protein